MAGVRIFTYANIAKETTRGTPVAPTRKLYAAGTWDEQLGLNFHEGENRGTRTRITRATQTTEDVAVAMDFAEGVAYDELPYAFAALSGGDTGTGAGADKTWTMTVAQAAANNPDSFTLDVGDDVQNWRLQYVMWTTIRLAAARGGLTTMQLDGFAQRAIKTAKATPANNQAVKIAGSLWTLKFASSIAGLGAASVQSNFLLDWSLDVTTGLRWRHYQDGNLYGSQHVETDIEGTLSLTVESTALAVSEIYDKWKAQTVDYVRLKATGPALGGSNYSAQIDLPIIWDDPGPLDGEDEGINLYNVTARLAYDDTSAASIAPVFVNSIAAL